MSKTLLAEYITRMTKNEPFRGLGLDHMNKPWPVIPSQLTSSAIRSSEFQVVLIMPVDISNNLLEASICFLPLVYTD